MVAPSPAHALAFGYVVVVSVAAAALILVGALLARLPLVPARGRDAYEGAMFGALGWLARPVDRLACRPTDRDVAGRDRGDTTD